MVQQVEPFLQYGALGLLVLFAIGLFAVFRLLLPIISNFLSGTLAAIREFFAGNAASNTESVKTLVAMRAEMVGGFAAGHERIDRLKVELEKRIGESGASFERRVTEEANRLECVIRERASNTGDELEAAVDRVARIPTGEHAIYVDDDRSIAQTPGRGFAPIRIPLSPPRTRQ